MKLFTKLFAILLVFACAIATVACQTSEDEVDNDLHGWAYEYEENEDEDGNKYGVIVGLYLSDGEKYALAEDDYDTIDLVIGEGGKITVPVYDEDGNEVYEDKKLKTEEKTYDYFEIADAAFANQLIIGSVKIADCVTAIGDTAFAGCSNIEKMELPFVGNKKGAVNASKTFADIFGTAEAAGCTSVTVNYNSSGSATYYVPSALKEVVVNYTGEDDYLPEYAFNGVTTLEKVTVNGILGVGASSFASCTSLYEVVLPDTVVDIEKNAFNGCLALIKFEFPSSLRIIGAQAFMNCSRFGYGRNTVVTIPEMVDSVGEKAFMNCVAITSLNVANLDEISISCFYGCTNLENVVLKAGARVANNAFGQCGKLKAANVVNYPGNANGAFDAEIEEA